MSVPQLDITLARVQDAMRGIKAVMTVLRRSAVAQSSKAAAGTRAGSFFAWCPSQHRDGCGAGYLFSAYLSH